MKRYLICMENSGFEFQTEHFINSKEFWKELEHDGYFGVGKGIYVPLEERNIKSIEYVGDI